MFNDKHFLVFISVLAFTTKLLFFALFLKNNPCMLEFDSSHYHKIALQIATGNGISTESGAPQFYRVPGYPIFLALCYKCFEANPIYAILFQILLSIFIAWLIFFLSLTIFPCQKKVAQFAALVACFDIGYLIFPGLVFTETLFVLFFTIFLILFLQNLNLFFCKSKSKQSLIQLFAAGVFLGIACLIRQVVPAMICVSIFLLLFTQKRLRALATFISGFLLATGWWLVRNYLLTGYIFFGTLSGPHFLNHAAVRLEMGQHNISHEQAQNNVYQKFNDLCQKHELELCRPLQEIEKSLIAEKLTLNMYIERPMITIKLWTTNILKSAFGLYSSELLFVDSGGSLPPYDNNRGLNTIVKRFLLPDVSNKWIIPVIYFEIFLLLFLLIGFFMFCASIFVNFNNLCVAFKAFPFIFAVLFITLACGYARLRLPIECFLITLASKAWIDFFKGRVNEE